MSEETLYEEALRILEAIFEHGRYMILEHIKEMDSRVLPKRPRGLEIELKD